MSLLSTQFFLSSHKFVPAAGPLKTHLLMQSAKVLLPECVVASAHPDAWVLSEWLVNPGSKVRLQESLAILRCSVDDSLVHVAAPRPGTLQNLRVQPGQPLHPLTHDPIASVEYCPHPVAFKGICAICGDDTDSLLISDSHHDRLTVAYNFRALSVSHAEAHVTATVLAKTLLNARKLSLVLDLDHTLVHATDDPRAGATLLSSPPGANLSSIGTIKLPSMRSAMHIKLRPYLAQFLERASSKFQLHIYTMGSRQYADKVAELIDPNKTFFHGRITSRDDFSEGLFNQKSIRRLFPCDDSMALIVDDREDVWTSAKRLDYMPNLVRAAPYVFWNGLHEFYLRNPCVLQPVQNEPRVKQGASELKSCVSVGKGGGQAFATKNGFSNTRHGPKHIAPAALSRRGPRRKRRIRWHDKQLSTDQDEGSEPPRKRASNGIRAYLTKNEHTNVPSSQSRKIVSEIIDTCINSAIDGYECDPAAMDTGYSQPVSDPGQQSSEGLSTKSSKTSHTDGTAYSPESDAKVCNGKTEYGGKLVESSGDANGRLGDKSSVKSLPSNFKAIVASWWLAESASESSPHLLRLIQILEECHQRFFELNDSNGRSSKSVGKNLGKAAFDGISVGPRADVKTVLASMRMEVLKGCSISFTGVIPTGLNGMTSPMWSLATRLGAVCLTEFLPGRTTHLLVTETESGRTRKFQEASRSGSVYVVTTEWLEDCAINFKRRPEYGYQLVWARKTHRQSESAEEYKQRIETCFRNEAELRRQMPFAHSEIPRKAKRRRIDNSRKTDFQTSKGTPGKNAITKTPTLDDGGEDVHVLEGEELDLAIESFFDDD